jgi:hypothetical protein
MEPAKSSLLIKADPVADDTLAQDSHHSYRPRYVRQLDEPTIHSFHKCPNQEEEAPAHFIFGIVLGMIIVGAD